MAIRALSLVFLFTFVSVIFGLPTMSERAISTHEEHTLPTELLPPLSDEKEHAIVYVINLYALKNDSTSDEMFQNEVIKQISEILDPQISVLLVVDDNNNIKINQRPPVNLDEFAEELEGQGFKVDKVNLNSKAKMLKMKLEKAEADSMISSALKGEKKYRQKRMIPMFGPFIDVLHLIPALMSNAGTRHYNPLYNPHYDPHYNPIIHPAHSPLVNPHLNPLLNPHATYHLLHDFVHGSPTRSWQAGYALGYPHGYSRGQSIPQQ